ncbi:bifunctional phosphopantothenoylcysteine decarboxylase/phosphopantothenate--cysteine ligase CoaBC [Pseudocolwellia sp. HL-MZ19]|uniref:bifunctional phosphopantothenoylcysteine decarboxylase/phosphopantothenate--cysteine ligase CoaBC n=1 Tax=Pseudocolwellia sp. HL-MZ19 TaxID=3400846 RepID=UPI003CF0FFBA
MLKGKNIVLGISGGIAAYKTPELVRRLKEHGANIRVVMTDGAKAFITPLTLQAVSGNAVSDSLLNTEAELAMGHIELAKWADLILIAPATADLIARITHGLANNLLTTICLASNAPLVIAPAMNQQMWHAQATQANINILKSRNITLWGPGAGEQACGDVGLGRMLDVPDLVKLACDFYKKDSSTKVLAGQHWVITAGPTREAIDPVRYISNHSSGKMGYSIAQAAQKAGAKVTIISGPVNISAPQDCAVINVNSARDMHQHAITLAEQADVFVACAAVADYRVAEVADHKIKKTADNDNLTIELVKNPDIVADVASLTNKPFTVGFAAETQDVEQYAKAKLARKNLDLICANNVSIAGQGFNSDDNSLTVFSAHDEIHLPLTSKAELAKSLVAEIAKKYVK